MNRKTSPELGATASAHDGAPLQFRLACHRCGFSGVWELAGLGMPCCPGCNTELQPSANTDTAATELDIMEAMPHDLVRLLTGAVLRHLDGPSTASRSHLAAAHEALAGAAIDLPQALQAVRHGLALAIQPGHVEARPETALLQIAYWLLAMEVQASELQRSFMAGGRSVGGYAA